MGRNKRRGGRGSPQKRDTPVKPALGRRQTNASPLEEYRRLLPNKHYEALAEEAEAEEMLVPTVTPTSPVWTSLKPAHCKPLLRLNSSAHTVNPRDRAVSPATPPTKKSGYQVSPAGHSTTQTNPDPEALKGGETSAKEEEQNLTVTPESSTHPSMESDTTFSSENDDDEDEDYCYSSATSSSSSFPSPEIFRSQEFVETVTSPINQELLGLHPYIKNSTLLDVSHAQSIHMHQPPNLSTIIDASTIPAEMCEISNHRRPEVETKIQTDSFKSDKASECKTPAKLPKKRPILCKKKVLFKSPLIAEIMEAKHTPAPKCTACYSSDPVQTSSPAEQMKPDAETFGVGEMNSKDTTIQLSVTLRRPVKSSPERAKFFDFIDSDRDVFFQKMRQRCIKLRSDLLFPLTATKCTVASVL